MEELNMAKKKPGADEPMVFGKFVKDIPVATLHDPPKFVLMCSGTDQKPFRATFADFQKFKVKAAPGDSVLGMRNDELVLFFPNGRKRKTK
jgi:hypothetical protein